MTSISSTAPSLALCLIARDEEAFIEGCLRSAAEVVDELVVLDTGSSDTTRAIAATHGASVYRFEWCDDFAAARNAALAHVTADWVLILDADERLATGAGATIQAVIANEDFDAAFLELHDAAATDATMEDVLSGESRIGNPILLPRLFRRCGNLRWSGVVHETTSQWLMERPERVATTGARIVHYGAVPEHRAALEKSSRNRRLLERRVIEEPDHPEPHRYLARS